MRLTQILILFFASSQSVIAQQKGYNRINFSFTPEYYFNKLYLENDGKEPNPMHVNNTTARAFAVEFEHGFRKGITITGGYSMATRTMM